MSPTFQIAGVLFLAISVFVHCVPFPITELYQGRLLGSSFGVTGANSTYDYLVVGGGNAGLTVAARLAEFASVAVIEAGGFTKSVTVTSVRFLRMTSILSVKTRQITIP